MILFVDLLNTIIQSFIVSYFPYYLSFNNENDRISKKHFVISIIGIFFTSMLATNIFSNGNITTAVIATMNIVIICLVYRHIYKKALLAYFIGYFLVQITAILVTSIIWPTISNVVSDAEASMLLGIYIPAIILELLIIKNKDNIKTIYQYFIKSERSFTIFFIIVILMDFIANISMLLNGWANVVLTNVVIIMFVAFIIGISIYRNSIGKKYEEIDRLNKLLIDKNNELKKIKHDYGSQISYINGLYIMQQYDRLGEMLKKIISGNAEVSSSVEYITNRDSIICSVVESLDLKDIHVVVDEEFDSNLIDISEYELHKIVSNILSNAATALDGNGLIVIKTYKIFNNIYLSIKNNGPQIDPSIIDKIFNTGFTTKSNKDESHGYGLHIVKEIVENNNGKIYVTSNEEYTEFKVIFSNKKAKEDFAKGEYQWVAQITNTLVFADPENTDARYLCADALEQLGYQAESGPWRSAYLCAAQELRNGTNTDDATRSSGNGDVFLHMTPDMILDYLGIFVDTTKIPDLTFTANIILPEGNYVLRVKNGVLLYQKDVQDPDADVTWNTKRAGLLAVVQKNAENVATLIEQEGDETCLTRLMDAVTVTSEYKYFNIIEP